MAEDSQCRCQEHRPPSGLPGSVPQLCFQAPGECFRLPIDEGQPCEILANKCPELYSSFVNRAEVKKIQKELGGIT